MKKYLFVLLSVFFAANVLHAQKPEVMTSTKPGWHKIGEAKVNFKTEKDEFLVLVADRFKAIRIKVKDAPIHIEDMQIHYEKGAKEDVQIRSNFNAGTESRVIDLKNHDADLKKVVFVYNTVPNSKVEKAEIELWGLK
ncbi:MAG TPA: hypothetical protein VK543_09070 [Puia sp.]|nr:hypothetical protein [Puia sp.]